MADAYEVPFFAANRVLPPASLANDFVAITPPTVVSPLHTR